MHSNKAERVDAKRRRVSVRAIVVERALLIEVIFITNRRSAGDDQDIPKQALKGSMQ
jgi:hypothetical protein